jgi:hypothetical protein
MCGELNYGGTESTERNPFSSAIIGTVAGAGAIGDERTEAGLLRAGKHARRAGPCAVQGRTARMKSGEVCPGTASPGLRPAFPRWRADIPVRSRVRAVAGAGAIAGERAEAGWLRAGKPARHAGHCTVQGCTARMKSGAFSPWGETKGRFRKHRPGPDID